MKIAIMGAGALGGYFGGRLAADGHEVALVARGAHLAAIRANGLRVISPKGDVHIPQILATDDPAEIGPADVVMFMVKNYDVEDAAHLIKPLLKADTMVVTCQNGVTAPDRLAAITGADHVVPGVARFPGDVAEPGVIRHSAATDMLFFGETSGEVSPRCQAFHGALVAAGTTPVIHENITHDLWAKFIIQASLSSITALTRLNIGPLRDDAEAHGLFFRSMKETEALGRAIHPDLPEGLTETGWKFLENFPPTMHASMLDDLERGKRIELEYLSGDVVRMGREHGVATPIHDVLYGALHPFLEGPPQSGD